jgi:hypothetical protein
MKSSSRFLIGFGIALAVVVVVAVALVLTTRGSVTLLPEDTPQGVVQRYLMAVQEKDYSKAYGFLRVDQNNTKLTYDEWLKQLPVPYPRSQQSSWKATLGHISETGSDATVEVIIDTFRPGGPLANPVNSQLVIFQLKKVGNAWFITSPPYLYWIY